MCYVVRMEAAIKDLEQQVTTCRQGEPDRRQQLHVPIRSNRRFRLADPLLWLVLRQLCPQWRDRLVLVQPVRVDRSHGERIHRCWRRRSRHPGRLRIDSECRGLILRLAPQNHLWGAPRVHDELLKFEIVVSERTASRYVPDRWPAPSHPRTFLANHLGQFMFISPETSRYVPRGDDVADASGLTFRYTRCRAIRSTFAHQCAVGERRSLRRRYVTRTSSTITLITASESKLAAAGARRCTNGSARPTCMPRESIGAPVWEPCDERRCRNIDRAGGDSPSRCSTARVFHRGRILVSQV
jgi:hypothetical protein